MGEIKIVINEKTPSVNHLYMQRGKMRFISPEGKRIRERISHQINSNKTLMANVPCFKNKHLEVTVEIHGKWYTKQGKVRRADIANREKFLIDSVFNALGLDDMYIFSHTMMKVPSEEEKAIIIIKILDGLDYL